MNNKIKAIVTDIDGTLYSHKSKRYPASTLEAIRIIRNKGYKIFICSGRNYYLIKKSGILNFIQPDGMITMNGAQVLINHESIYLHPIPQETVNALIKFSKRLKFGLTLIEEFEGHINMIDDRVIQSHEKYGTRFPQPRTFPENYDRVVYQAICFCDEFDESLFLPHLKECKTARWDTYAVDIMPFDSDKSLGMLELLKHLNWTKENVIAIGDGENDIEMIETAGIGIAMGNGKDSLKEKADYVTDDIDKSGYAKALHKFGLIDDIELAYCLKLDTIQNKSLDQFEIN